MPSFMPNQLYNMSWNISAYFAYITFIKGGYTGRVKKWLSGQQRNVDHCRDQDEGGTALHWAAYYGRLEIVKMLIENSASKE